MSALSRNLGRILANVRSEGQELEKFSSTSPWPLVCAQLPDPDSPLTAH